MNKLHKYEIVSLFGIGILFIIFGLKDYPFFSFNDFRIFIKSLGFFAPIFYTIVATISSLLTFPISILIVVAGITFGLKMGYIISVISITLSAIFAFKISNSYSNKFKSAAKKQKFSYISRLVNTINTNAKKHQFLSIFILRSLFLPYIEIAYAAGLVKELKFKCFFLATFISNLIEVFIFIYLGDAVTESIQKFIFGVLLFILFIISPRIFKKYIPHFKKFHKQLNN